MTSLQGDGPTEEPVSSDHEPLSLSALDVRRTRVSSPDATAESVASPLTPTALSRPGSRSTTLSGFLSRSSSPNGRAGLSLARFGRSSTASPLTNIADSNDETRAMIVRAFSPVVGVLASEETDELARSKGFQKGFISMVQPYGERINGKVVVRDSVGASRSWDDFGVRFADLQHLMSAQAQPDSNTQLLENLEDVVEQYLEQHTGEFVGHGYQEMSPYYSLYLSRLLSSQAPSNHESLFHPVTAVIAISSSTPSPIETLRNLYAQTAQGRLVSAPFANPEYLRYYLLVHDDDQDDFAKTSALFDQMKRHFGLHCHLLRLRSTPCTAEGEDIERIPEVEWLSATDELSHLQETQLLDLDNTPEQSLFASDAVAIRTFVRELVLQSVVPHMEQRISLWNEQIASRRRGISGRFMSLSKRWGGLGGLGSSRNSSASNLSATSSSSGNYDSVQGYYRWDTSEALLRRMADFAMMLRDYKLAASTYELLRSDYNNDKAWKYLAGANEMCCISTLLNPMLSSSTSGSGGKTLPRLETFDTMLDTAVVSYLTRANEPALALRCVLVTVELLKVRGRLASELASKWAIRALESNMVASSSNSHVLVSERIASCFAGMRLNKIGTGQSDMSHRLRHAALWSLTSAEEWMKLGRAPFAAARLDDAHELYAETMHHDSALSDKGFREMTAFMQELSLTVRLKMGQARKRGASGVSATGNLIEPLGRSGDAQDTDDEEVETAAVETLDTKPRGHQRQLTLNSAVDTAYNKGSLSPTLMRHDPLGADKLDDDFE